MTNYFNAMRKYATFSGRASRSEFWLFSLIVFLMLLITATLDGLLGFADEGALVLTGVVSLVHIIPSLSVSVRRLHDIDKSGWWLLLSIIPLTAIVLLVFCCLESTRGSNRFGNQPNGLNDDPHNGFNNNIQPMQQNHDNASASSTQAAQNADPLEQLNKLKGLHESGALDDDEFAKMKAEIIGKVD